jgi:hypothetical protein
MTIDRSLMQRPRLQRLAAAAAITPALSLLVGRVIAWVIGTAGLGSRLPVGLHTYVPVVDLLNVHLLEVGGGLLALLGVALGWLAQRADGPTGRRGGLENTLRLVGLLALAQVSLYATEAVVVAQLQGLPDAGGAVLVALILPVLLIVALAAVLGSAAALLTMPRPVRGALWNTASSALPIPGRVSTPSGRPYLLSPRRGPPILLPD